MTVRVHSFCLFNGQGREAGGVQSVMVRRFKLLPIFCVLCVLSAYGGECFNTNTPYLSFAIESWTAIKEAIRRVQAQASSLGASDRQRIAAVNASVVQLQSEKMAYIAKLKRFQTDQITAAEVNPATQSMMDLVQDTIRKLNNLAARDADVSTSDAFKPLADALVQLREAKSQLCQVKDPGSRERGLSSVIEALQKEVKTIDEVQPALAKLAVVPH